MSVCVYVCMCVYVCVSLCVYVCVICAIFSNCAVIALSLITPLHVMLLFLPPRPYRECTESYHSVYSCV